jgi:hypothetical protein
MAIVAAAFIAIQLALILQLPVPSYLTWSVVAAVGAGTVLSYAIVAEYFPKELAGRANGALNVFHLGGAFLLQYSIGLILQQWAPNEGHYPASAYQIAFGVNVALQVMALIWFEFPRGQRFWIGLLSSSQRNAFDPPGGSLQSRSPHRRAARIWARRVDSAFAQARNWQAAAVGSTILSALLGLAVAVSTGRPSATTYIIDASRIAHASDDAHATGSPPDADLPFSPPSSRKSDRLQSIP